jgi:hypothetical protein
LSCVDRELRRVSQWDYCCTSAGAQSPPSQRLFSVHEYSKSS